MINTKRICILDLKAGDIVHEHGARWLVLNVQIKPHSDGDMVLSSTSQWLSGATTKGYFDESTIDWNFQGNHKRLINIEV
jgi:hypothetical protein